MSHTLSSKSEKVMSPIYRSVAIMVAAITAAAVAAAILVRHPIVL